LSKKFGSVKKEIAATYAATSHILKKTKPEDSNVFRLL